MIVKRGFPVGFQGHFANTAPAVPSLRLPCDHNRAPQQVGPRSVYAAHGLFCVIFYKHSQSCLDLYKLGGSHRFVFLVCDYIVLIFLLLVDRF